jgi:hypothetical protein
VYDGWASTDEVEGDYIAVTLNPEKFCPDCLIQYKRIASRALDIERTRVIIRDLGRRIGGERRRATDNKTVKISFNWYH